MSLYERTDSSIWWVRFTHQMVWSSDLRMRCLAAIAATQGQSLAAPALMGQSGVTTQPLELEIPS